MTKRLEKLISIGSEQLGPPSKHDELLSVTSSRLTDELFNLLSKKNGFFAFESALHVFPSRLPGSYLSLEEWNKKETWRDQYQKLANGLFFFAQDIFGVQHCIREDEICTFDPETGETESLASSFEEWAAKILDDYEFLTGYPIAHEWQIKNGQLDPSQRLMPKTLFVFGGKYEIGNLTAIEARKSMLIRAGLAIQIKDIPDGQKIKFEVVD